MRKAKKTAVILAALMMLSMAGCNKDKESSNAGTVDSKKSTTTAENSSKDSSDETSKAKETEKEDWFDWSGIKIYRPTNFEKENLLGENVYTGKMNTDDTIYYNLFNYPTYFARKGEFEAKDVPEIFNKDIFKNVKEFIPCFESKFSMSVESEKECELLERPFIRRTGIIHTERDAEKADLYYVAYYGVMHFSGWSGAEKVPTAWMAFADAKDEATKKEIEKLVDTTAERLEPTK